MKKRKLAYLFISAMILCCCAAGCGNNSSNSGNSAASAASSSDLSIDDLSSNAKKIHYQLSSSVTMAVINGVSDPSGICESGSEGDASVMIGSYEDDISDVFDGGFTGYYYAVIEGTGVSYTLWSASPIAEANKHQLTQSEAESLSIGCYPYAS